MHTAIRKIGNSRGVILPAAVLAECGIKDGDALDLTLEQGALVLRPVSAPRAGWFDMPVSATDVDAWSGLVETETEQEDWQW